ncbi:hypothetical protein BCR44DRAFT_39016 [Catenaria anguillulae PL171]|uniref:Uncharacterized protein n=1 Tax=Catenaria anguillulae PL171 TaxID=765915 RepID=A0A1Y2HKF3_9FUNG|nr:hypothetical protein BCR44DRAFT_39016 [Catenaria anguillulae PL171]
MNGAASSFSSLSSSTPTTSYRGTVTSPKMNNHTNGFSPQDARFGGPPPGAAMVPPSLSDRYTRDRFGHDDSIDPPPLGRAHSFSNAGTHAANGNGFINHGKYGGPAMRTNSYPSTSVAGHGKEVSRGQRYRPSGSYDQEKYGGNEILGHQDAWLTDRPILWASDPFPSYLVSRFIGPKGEYITKLNDMCPGVVISIVAMPDDPDQLFNLFHVYPRLNRDEDVVSESLKRARAIIVSILSAVFVRFPSDLRHVLCVADKSQQLVWLRVSESLSSLAANLDSMPPLYTPIPCDQKHLDMLKQQGSVGRLDELSLDELADALNLFDDAKEDADPAASTRLVHNQCMTISTDPVSSHWDKTATCLATKLMNVRQFYWNMRPKFALKAVIGMHVYTQHNIMGPLSLSLPTGTNPTGSPFESAHLPGALDRGELKASMFTTLHPGTLRAVVQMMPSLGCTTTNRDREKVTVYYVMKHDPTNPIPMGYNPVYTFRATFVFDRTLDKYVLSRKGLHIRSADISKYTMVDLSRPVRSVPVAYRIMQAMQHLVQPKDVYASADAFAMLDALERYINGNLAELKHPTPVGQSLANRRAHALEEMPVEFAGKLSELTIRHRRRVKFRKGPVDISVNHLTYYYRRDRWDAASGTVLDPVTGRPIPHPTSVYIKLKHVQYAKEMEGKADREVFAQSKAHVIELCKVAHEVCDQVQHFVDKEMSARAAKAAATAAAGKVGSAVTTTLAKQ